MVEFFFNMSAVMPTKEEERIKKNGMVYMFICIYSLYGYIYPYRLYIGWRHNACIMSSGGDCLFPFFFDPFCLVIMYCVVVRI